LERTHGIQEEWEFPFSFHIVSLCGSQLWASGWNIFHCSKSSKHWDSQALWPSTHHDPSTLHCLRQGSGPCL
jgi:hypothetical protein